MSTKNKSGKKGISIFNIINKGITEVFVDINELTPDENESIKKRPREAIQRFINKTQVLQDLDDLIYRITMGQELAKLFKEDEPRDILLEAIISTTIIKKRFKKWNKLEATDLEINAIVVSLDVIDELQDNCSRRELLNAFRSFTKSIVK